MQQIWPKQSDAVKFYGNPAASGWQAKNLVIIKPPFDLFYDGSKVKGVTIHEKCAASLALIFAAIWEAYGKDQGKLDGTGFTRYSGSFSYRNIRGGNKLSMHAFAAALDFDAEHNAQTFSRTDGLLKASSPIVAIFEGEGWTWGGRWKGKRDPMHFQAASV